MSARTSRLLDRCWITCLGIVVVILAGYMGAVAGVRRWPYEVVSTTVITPQVVRGDEFYMSRVIDYQDDCVLTYKRMMVSNVPGLGGAYRRDVLQPIQFDSPPWQLDNQPWYISEKVPEDWPCGPAMIVDSPTAACNWFQRIFWWQRRPDAVTQFTVTCVSGEQEPLPHQRSD